MRILVPLGTRPEIIKLAPVVRALRRAGFTVRTVATGQHYDPSLTDTFYDALDLQPDERWTLEGDEAARVGGILASAYRELEERPTDLVMVLGDTYTVPVFCLAARRYGVPVAHLEAGLRSFNPTSMEEVDRKVAAATASLHFAPTPLAARFLMAEGVDQRRVRVVGNPVTDVLRELGITRRPPDERAGIVVTAHRRTNVDDPARLARLVELVERATGLGPVSFPVHPRTRGGLEASGGIDRLAKAGVRILPPVPYEEMLDLLAGSRVVLTDSGGLQEEASWFGVPVVVLRRSTPRWESVALGTAALVGLDVDLALHAAARFATEEEQWRVFAVPCPYGDGSAAQQVTDALLDPATAALLALDEPDFVGAPVPS